MIQRPTRLTTRVLFSMALGLCVLIPFVLLLRGDELSATSLMKSAVIPGAMSAICLDQVLPKSKESRWLPVPAAIFCSFYVAAGVIPVMGDFGVISPFAFPVSALLWAGVGASFWTGTSTLRVVGAAFCSVVPLLLGTALVAQTVAFSWWTLIGALLILALVVALGVGVKWSPHVASLLGIILMVVGIASPLGVVAWGLGGLFVAVGVQQALLPAPDSRREITAPVAVVTATVFIWILAFFYAGGVQNGAAWIVFAVLGTGSVLAIIIGGRTGRAGRTG